MSNLETIIFNLYPELLILIGLVVAIILSTTKYKDSIWVFNSLFITVGAIFIFQNQLISSAESQILGGSLVFDNLSNVLRLLTLGVSLLLMLGSVRYSDGFVHKAEFMVLMMSAILGVMFLVSANDLITLFVALETLGLSSIMLAGYSKYDPRSNEAALKYLLNSAAATAIFLFGLSIIYGLTGSTQFYEVKYILGDLFENGDISASVILLSIVLVTTGLGFKLASAPMHMWSPDVYEGAPTPVTAFLSIVSKTAAIGITIRLLYYLFDFAHSIWQPLVVFMAILSMIIGNLVALSQVINNASIKRLMAYSSIAQVGYILIGIAIGTPFSIGASIFYLIIYSIMNAGAFLCIISFGNQANSDSISDYGGLISKRPLLVFAFAVCLFNLGGLPLPPAGFISKFILIKAAFQAGSLGVMLGMVALITTVLSIYYYSYIVKVMIVNKESQAVLNMDDSGKSLGPSRELNSAIALAVILIFTSVLFSNKIHKLSKRSLLAFSPSSCPCAISYNK